MVEWPRAVGAWPSDADLRCTRIPAAAGEVFVEVVTDVARPAWAVEASLCRWARRIADRGARLARIGTMLSGLNARKLDDK